MYTGGALIHSLVQLIVGFVIAIYVPPKDLGLWTTLNLAVTYTGFLQAGLISGLNRELPFSLGKRKYREAKIMAGTVQSITVVTSVLILLAGIICFLFLKFDNNKIKYGVLAITIYIISLFFQNYFTSTYRSNSSFISLSKIQTINAVINFISIVLIIYLAYYGMILKSVIVSCLFTLHLFIERPIKVGFIISKKLLSKILKTGLPIWLLAYSESLASTSDKIWLLKYSDLSSVGIYSFAFYGYSLFLILSSTIAKYITPRMTYNYGLNNNKKAIWKYFKKTTSFIFIFQFIIMLGSISIIPDIISKFFSQYISSIRPMQILIIAGMLKGSIIGVNALISIKAIKHLTIYQIIYSILLLGFPLIGIKLFNDPIIGVCYGILIANLINFGSGVFLTRNATQN